MALAPNPPSISSSPILVFDYPRTRSNLFGRLFASHPALTYHRRPFVVCSTRGPEIVHARVGPTTLARLAPKREAIPPELAARWSEATFARANAEVEVMVERDEDEGKRPWIQEHAASVMREDTALGYIRQKTMPSTDTCPARVSDSLLQNCTPVFLIRHPGLTIPSFYRMQQLENLLALDDEAFDYWTSLEWSRMLFDHLAFRQRRRGLVVDADDLVVDPEGVIARLCDRLTIDPSGVQLTWKPDPDAPPPEGVVPSWIERLNRSKGVIREPGKAEGEEIDIDSLERDWTVEFGPYDARVMKEKVKAQMPSYRYLREHRI